MLCSEVMQEADSENLLLCPPTDLSSADNSGASLCNLTNWMPSWMPKASGRVL